MGSGSEVDQTNQYEKLLELFGATTIMVIGLMALIIAILVIVAMWRIFKKAGEPGWKAIIPIYNNYILFKIVWDTKFFWISFGLGLLSSIVNVLPAIGWLSYLISIATFIIEVMVLNRLSKSFGHGTGFTIGLLFLPFIFFMILGFGSDEFSPVNE